MVWTAPSLPWGLNFNRGDPGMEFLFCMISANISNISLPPGFCFVESMGVILFALSQLLCGWWLAGVYNFCRLWSDVGILPSLQLDGLQ